MYLNVPIPTVRYCVANSLRKPLGLYLAMQFANTGKIHASSSYWRQIKAVLNMKDDRTLRRHLKALQGLKWVSHNPVSGYYFIKSFERVRAMLGVKDRGSCQLFLNDLSGVQSWRDSVIINCVIRNQKYYWIDGPKRFKKVRAHQKEGANTIERVDAKTEPKYFGLCNASIAKHLNCSPSQACKRKRAAEKAGFLSLKKHFTVIANLPEGDSFIRNHIAAGNPDEAKKLRFRRATVNGVNVVQLVRQLHDEIVPHIVFSERKKISSLLMSSGVHSL